VFSPMYTGQTAPAWQPTLLMDGGAPLDLTTASTFAVRFSPMGPGAGTPFSGAGTFSIVSPATGGTARYLWAVADTAIANVGRWEVQVTVTFADGTEAKTDPIPWILTPAL